MTSATKGIFIVAAKRTPFGAFGGKLAGKTTTDLGETAAKAALLSAKIDPSIVDSVVVGNVYSSASTEGIYVARHILLRCGIPISRTGLSVNQLAGSGFQAVINGANDILLGCSKVVLTVGTENMSRVPFVLRNTRFGIKLGREDKLEDHLWTSALDKHCNTVMGQTAENVAEKYNVTREDADNFAFQSHQRWSKANDEGRFLAELAPVTIKSKGRDVNVDVDEHPRPSTTLEQFAKLPPVFKENGTVTAGNACGVSDGAGAIILASEDAVREHNWTPLARLVGYASVGVEPTIMGIGPVDAIPRLLSITGRSLNDIDLFDINEAFSSQVIACQKALDLDPSKFNVNGGAVAIGHPLSASGARITAHLVHELKRRGKKLGIGSGCLGGGQGIALLLESV